MKSVFSFCPFKEGKHCQPGTLQQLEMNEKPFIQIHIWLSGSFRQIFEQCQ